MAIVCQLGIKYTFRVHFTPNNQIKKVILATGDISSPKTAIKLAKKSGNLNHLKSIIIKESIKKTLQIIANREIKAKKPCVNIFLMILN